MGPSKLSRVASFLILQSRKLTRLLSLCKIQKSVMIDASKEAAFPQVVMEEGREISDVTDALHNIRSRVFRRVETVKKIEKSSPTLPSLILEALRLSLESCVCMLGICFWNRSLYSARLNYRIPTSTMLAAVGSDWSCGMKRQLAFQTDENIMAHPFSHFLEISFYNLSKGIGGSKTIHPNIVRSNQIQAPKNFCV